MESPSPEVTPKSWRLKTQPSTPQMSPYSVHEAKPSEPDNVMSTTVVADNIHCGSCVRHIEGLLGALGSDIISVSVSVVSHEIHVLHQSTIGGADICNILEDGAFEVSNATTVDKQDSVAFEYLPRENHREGGESWLRTLRPTLSSRNTSRASISCLPTPSRSKRLHHIANCSSCQENERQRLHSEQGLGAEKRLGPDQNLHSDQSEVEHRPQTIRGPKQVDDSSLSLDNERSSSMSKKEVEGPSKASASRSIPKETAQLSIDQSHGQNAKLKERPEELQTTILSIGGMTCSSCTNAVTDALQEMEGVQSVSVDLMSNSATVEHIADQPFTDRITETVEDLGYEAFVVEQSSTLVKTGKKSPTASGKVQSVPRNERKESRTTSETLHYTALDIEGMTCASCSSAITNALQPLVQHVEVSLLTNSAKVAYKGEEKLVQIIESIEDIGYGATVQSAIEEASKPSAEADLREVQLKVDGMFCEHCPSRIEKGLEAKFGESLQIQRGLGLKNSMMTVIYQPDLPRLSIRSIVETIESLNSDFRATIYHPPSIETRSQQVQLRERKKILLRLLLSAVAAIPTLIIGIIFMSLVPEGDPTRAFFEQQIWAGAVTRAQWALFILATPVYFFAADMFHVRAFKEVRSLWRRRSKVPILRRFYRFGSMSLLISAGTTVAYVSSLALLILNATRASSPDSSTYFDSVVFLTFFIILGRYLEALGKSKAGNAVAMLGKLRPEQAMLVVSSQSLEKEESNLEKIRTSESYKMPTRTRNIDSDLLEIGDTVVIAHGSSPPADGILVSETGQFDESSLTGESRPIKKVQNDEIFVGTINTGNPVHMMITKLGGTSMLDQIISVVREGQTKRAPVERVADIITGYFVPIITALAIITFFVWFALGQSGALDSIVSNPAGGWAFFSLEFAIAVFVVACPCGIGLAAPTALFVGGGLAAKHGILVRGGGEAFQEAGSLDAIVFDKTGTLTEGGDLKVTDNEILSRDVSEDHLWAIIAAIESSSSHPIARALLALATEKSKLTPSEQNIEEEPGRGLRGTFTFKYPFNSSNKDSHITYEAALGSESLASSLSPTLLANNTFAPQTLSTWKSQAKSVAVLCIRRLTSSATAISEKDPNPWTLASLFAISDALRPSALPTVHALQQRGIAVYMLSGDNRETAHAVGSSLSIPITNIFAGVLPTEKADKIRHLQQTLTPRSSSGSNSSHSRLRSLFSKPKPSSPTTSQNPPSSPNPAKIAFVGDGINDAPALLASTVSISLSTGSPIALTSSSFILMSPSLETIITLLDLSQRVFNRIKFNFAWALVYNVLLVPVAAGVFFRVREGGWYLGPVWAAAAMALSSVSVVVGSLALRWERGWRFWRGGKRGVGEEREGEEREGEEREGEEGIE